MYAQKQTNTEIQTYLKKQKIQTYNDKQNHTNNSKVTEMGRQVESKMCLCSARTEGNFRYGNLGSQQNVL